MMEFEAKLQRTTFKKVVEIIVFNSNAYRGGDQIHLTYTSMLKLFEWAKQSVIQPTRITYEYKHSEATLKYLHKIAREKRIQVNEKKKRMERHGDTKKPRINDAKKKRLREKKLTMPTVFDFLSVEMHQENHLYRDEQLFPVAEPNAGKHHSSFVLPRRTLITRERYRGMRDEDQREKQKGKRK